jgi:hypothetical protein
MPIPSWLKQFNSLWLFDELRHDDRPLSKSAKIVVIGQFFEALTATIFKAEHAQPPEGWEAYPDVIHWNQNGRDILYEVKASKKGRHIIDGSQIDGYEKMLSTPFPFTNPDLRYVLYYYDGITLANFDVVRDLVSELSKSIRLALRIPFSLILKIKENSKQYDYDKWKADRRQHYFRINKIPSDLIMKQKAKGLREFFNLVIGPNALDGYHFKTVQIRPKRMLEHTTNSFEMIEVSH